MLNANPSGDEEGTREKRSGVRMDFMGMRIANVISMTFYHSHS